MGNVCCCQEDQTQRHPVRPVVRTRASTFQLKSKNEEDMLLQSQKMLVHDFAPAIHYLKNNSNEGNGNKYRGFYTHLRIATDQVSEYFSGTLLEENGIQFACIVKKINKFKVTTPAQKKSLAIEYLITRYLNYPFIVNCLHFHEDSSSLYMFFDLRSYEHLSAFGKDSSKEEYAHFFQKDINHHIRFVIAGVILALEKLHAIGIVYRGVNMENIVIMDNGYPLLTNLSRLHPEGYGDTSPAASHFTSPEEFRGQAVTKATDCWALGVLIFYLCKGTFINYSTFRERQFQAEGISPELADLVNQLLLFKPDERLGTKGISLIKAHPFFQSFKWQQYQEMSLESPLSIEKTNLSKTPLDQEYSPQSQYCGLGDVSMSTMGLMLFMDLMTLTLINQAFEAQQHNIPQIQGEQDFNKIDEYQLATEIDIGGDYD